jgi:hypothetical protein
MASGEWVEGESSYIADPEKQERLLQDAASRVSEVLFRIANSADLTGLSLEVDLAGVELAHAGEAREHGEGKKATKLKVTADYSEA